jgi:hydroxypyruvate reductase/glycerate 2-kinase
MNAVRKHLSAIKGGRLAEAFAGRRQVSLIISDVIGDPLDVIASGPTAPDPTTFADCAAILAKYDLLGRVPPDVRRHLDAGVAGDIPETPKSLPATVENRVIGNCDVALAAAEKAATLLGYFVENLGSEMAGDTGELARRMIPLFSQARPTCILSGGETTVTLPAEHGKGGRNQEFVLTLVAEMAAEKWRNAVVLSGGTDGEDGPTDAAGAIADLGTLERAQALGLDARDYLGRHDAYEFFRKTGDLVISGPTDTNVMDVRVILVRSV